MDVHTKRRITVFGAGMLLGTPLAIALFSWATSVQESQPREVNNIEVVLTSCDLRPGDLFEERCVERRVVAEQFTPPDVIASDNIASWLGKPVYVELAAGSAVRTVDFQPQD